MNNLLYIIAIILLVGWFIGAFVFAVGKLIHVLLVFAIAVLLLKIIRGRRA